MLASLSIRDIVLIDTLDLTFDAGLSALTGETGAGKSILLGALGLACGERAERAQVRAGADKAVATSSPMGSRFDPQGGYHHLLDPRSGKPANHHQTISVIAETAALADGLSTALSTIAPDDIASILKRETTIEVLGVDRFGRKFRA